MGVQHVLVVETLLMGQLIRNRLSQWGGLDVIGVTPRNEADLIEAVGHARPDVLILDKTAGITDFECLTCLLKEFHKLMVIVVSAEDNVAQIYGKRQRPITQGSDLAAIIDEWAAT